MSTPILRGQGLTSLIIHKLLAISLALNVAYIDATF